MPCCEALLVFLEQVIVKQLTTGPGNDEIIVTATSAGRHATDPATTSWPGPNIGEISVGKDQPALASPVQLARIEPDADCKVNFRTTVTIWEADLNDIAKTVDATVEAARKWADGLVPTPTGTEGTTDKVLDAITAIIREILNLFGLSDDFMGTVTIGASESLTNDKPLKDWDWSPSWATAQLEAISHNEVRFKTTLHAHGGIWDVSFLAKRICAR